jgi:hypothetical protein
MVVIVYVLGCISLSGTCCWFSGAFRTLGVSNKKYLSALSMVPGFYHWFRWHLLMPVSFIWDGWCRSGRGQGQGQVWVFIV